jgi:phage/plasmid-associated DNA primase
MDKNRHWPDRSKLDYVQVEMEAEAVSWLVCQRNGVHTKSREYLSALVGGVNPAGISIYTIFEAANRVESRTASVVRKQWIIADDTQRSAN